ncbi:MAG: ABC transporter substrate-binding protein [Devosia nanyangense]|uniref:ABC transporter substrate-binding protein n=1 Tax=Devosia nanyangense TaxID=1228055 RepID=A0A933L718_9HYPH|nr:ABC transporter substrate-binding protein [Devosia nanyangense]
MTRCLAAIGLLLAFAVQAGATFAGGSVTIGYLGLSDDPRYQPDLVYTRIEINPPDDPTFGAKMGVDDLGIIGQAVGMSFTLDFEKAADITGLVDAVRRMVAAGEHFVIVDLPASLLDQVAALTRDQPVTLINATAPDDYLRTRCYPNLLHSAASDRMLADAMVQYLRTQNWTRVLVLYGEEKRDKEIADAFTAAAQRLRLDIADTRQFTLATDPANREQNNAKLITGGADYDLVFLADSFGEFGRYLPYATQLPRPVVGTAGLVASAWHWSADHDSATQVTLRFGRFTNGLRMTGHDWSTWMAAKAIVTSYVKANSEDFKKVDAFMRSNRLRVDGSKGVSMNFRPWDGQLRMPIMLSTSNAVIDVAPLEGFLHQTNVLDTLGTDEPEFKCQ